MGIELPPELADVAAEAGVTWPEADEEAMARQAQAWRDTATSMSTLTTDADTTARSALTSMSGDTATAASAEWKTFVEPDSGHLTSVVRDANAAADRLEHAADQVGAAKVEIVRNLVNLAQNKDAAQSAAQAGHPTALAGLDTAVRGTAANVAHIQSQLVTAVQPGAGVDMSTVQNPVNANPGHHLLSGVTTTAAPVTDVVQQTTGAVSDTVGHAQGAVTNTTAGLTGAPGHSGGASDLVRHGGAALGNVTDQVLPGTGDVVHHATGAVSDTAGHAQGAVADTTGAVVGAPGHPGLADGLVQTGAGAVGQVPGAVGQVPGVVGQVPGAVGQVPGAVPGDVLPGHGQNLPFPGDTPAGPAHPGAGVLPGDPDITGPVPVHDFPGADVPTPPAGQTVQSGFVGGLEPAAAAPGPAVNLPPAAAAPPLAQSPPASGFSGGPGFAGGPVPGAPPVAGGAPPVAAAPAAPTAQPPARPTAFSPAPAAPVPAADRPQEPAPRKHIAGPPGAPPPAKGERNEVLAAFWIHMFPIGHLPVASYRPARQLPPPPPELDYAAGLRFEPADHPRFDLVDATERLAVLRAAIAQQQEAANREHFAPPPSASYPPAPPAHPAEAVAAGYAPAPPPAPEPAAAPSEPPGQKTDSALRPVDPSAGLTADHPKVQALLEDHDPLGDVNERDWDRRYLVRLGSVTAHGISPEGLEYNWPTSEQFPEGGSAEGEAEVLAEDTVIDRFGTPYGRVFAADGTPFGQRSLPPAHKDIGYRRYRVLKPLPVWRAVSAAWFAQTGGGVRYRTTHSAAELVAMGYLEEIA